MLARIQWRGHTNMVWEGGLAGCPGAGEMVGVGVRGNWRKFWTTEGFLGSSKGKESACNAGDLGLIPGLARSSRKGNGNPLQYSCLKNPMDRGAWWPTGYGVTKSQTWLSDSHTHTHTHTHTLNDNGGERVSELSWLLLYFWYWRFKN